MVKYEDLIVEVIEFDTDEIVTASPVCPPNDPFCDNNTTCVFGPGN